MHYGVLMAIGNQSTYSTSSLNAEMAQVAVDFHHAADHALDFFERINALGVAGLQAIGFSSSDATAFFTLANQMNTAALIWMGSATQSQVFNYDNASAIARLDDFGSRAAIGDYAYGVVHYLYPFVGFFDKGNNKVDKS